MGVTRAPVAGSGSAPAWTRRVSRPHASFVMFEDAMTARPGSPDATRFRRYRLTMRRSTIVLVALAVLTLGACVVSPPAAPAQFADRQTDPVVLTGAQVPTLHGVAVGDIVAFRYTGSAWKQFPVQVDQRKTVELATVYHQ